MSVESRRELEYLNYLRFKRASNERTLGGAVTALFLSPLDMGLSPLGEAASVPRARDERPDVEIVTGTEVTSLREARRRRLGDFATQSAEIGFAKAA